MLFKISIRKKWPILCLRIPVLQSKQVIKIRCIADQTRSKYDQLTLYRRPPRCFPAQHTTRGVRDNPRPFFNRLKNVSSRSPWPLRAGQTNLRCILDHHTPSPIKARSLPIRPFFSERGRAGIDRLSGRRGLYISSFVCYINMSLIFCNMILCT